MIELTGYQIGTQLHAGQTSLVYRAVRLVDGVPVVVKFLRNEFPTAQESARYQREFAVAGSLKLKGCVGILAMEIAQHRSVLIYEDDGSVSLRRLYAGRALDTLRWLHIAIESCKCLQELHAHKLVHRDINPSNVLMNSQTLIVKLTDLELAGPASSADETQERAFGTVAYMAPEQSGRIRAAIDARSDLYSFGAMIFELATGRSVFIGPDDLSLMHAHLALQPESPTVLNPDFPAILAKIVLRLLAKSPNDRYQSARGLLNDLSRVQALLTGKVELDAIDFELGQLDHANALASADVLYGQDSARADLESQIARTQRDGTRALISISGLAGSGKSLLVERFSSSYSGSVFFGRCERLDRSVPYSGLISALHPVAQRWLGLEQSALESLKRKLIAALGVNAAVLLPLMPDLPKLLGKLPPILPLGAGAEQARFQLAVRAFFQVCTQHFQPFLIALDDFHWADQATLALLEKLLSSDLQGWCLISTERAEAQGADLHAWRDRIKASGVRVQEIELLPLSASHISSMLQDGLGEIAGGAAMQARLAELTLQKTLGNPYFVRQFLRTLISQELLERDASSGAWRFDPRKIAEQNLTDNVLTLLGQRVNSLPREQRELLQIAGCIGLQFDLQTLGELNTRTGEVSTLCNAMLESGLLVPGTQIGSLRFAHERLREAVLASCSEDQRAGWHWQIGMRWQQQYNTNSSSNNVFDVVSQLNRGVSLIESDADRMALVSLNVLAAQRARQQTAYDAALEYASFAASSLPFSAFESQPELVLEAYRLLAESQASTGALDPAVLVFQQALALTNDPVQNAKTLERLSDALQSSGKASEALIEVRRALGLLGQNLQLGQAQQAAEQDELVRILSEPATLVQFSELKSASGTAAQIGALYDKAIIAVYFSCPEHLAFVTARSVKHVLDSGLTPESGIALGWWGMILVMFDRHALAAQYAQFAIDTHARFRNDYYGGGAKMLAQAMSLCWTKPYAENQTGSEDAYQLCHQSGNLQFASYALITLHISHVAQASDLSAMLSSAERWRDYCARYVPLELGQAQIRSHCVRQLMGQSPPPLDTEQILADYEAQQNATDVCESLTEIARIAMHLDQFDIALKHAERAAPMFNAGAAGSLLLNYLHHMVLAIASARMMAHAEPTEQQRLWQVHSESAQKIQSWSAHSQQNFQAYFELVSAEGLRARGLQSLDSADTELLDQASSAYLRAIAHAQAQRQSLLQAQATQYLAELFQKRGHSFASGLSRDAEQLYRRAGAMAKLSDAGAAATRIGTRTAVSPSETLRSHRSSSTGSHSVDLLSVLKASEVISSEINLDQLITRLLGIAIENAGAQRGLIVLKSPDGFFVRADSENGCINVALASYPQAPKKLLSYVSRAVVPVVMDDGAGSGQFRDDPYFMGSSEVSNQKVRSVLCAPLLRQGDLRGLLYLENNAVSGAFTYERLETLNMLLSSAAIAIENAEFYSAQQRYTEQLEARVFQRTAELERANQALARLAEIDGLTQLSNRRTFDAFCQTLAHQGSSVGMLLCDVDDFKSYNDHYGHPGGDEVLRQVAAALTRMALPTPSLVARYGGEEFAVVFSAERAEQVLSLGVYLNQAIATLALPHAYARAANYVSVSVGCAFTAKLSPDGITALIGYADTALYQAKRNGRNRAVI